MELGVLLKKYAGGIGVYEIQPNESIFNRRNIGVLIVFGQSVTSITAYLLFGAATIQQYEECFFLWSASIASTIGFFVTILKTRTIFHVLDQVNNFIVKRAEDPILRNLYHQAIEQIELLTRILHFTFVKVLLPIGVLPLFFLSYYRYFTTDLGRDSFLFFNAIKYPFDERTPIGYAVAEVLIGGAFYVVLYTVSCALSLVMIIYRLGTLLSSDLQEHVKGFDELNGNHLKMVEWTKELLFFCASLKETYVEVNDVMEMIITLVYVFSIVSISDTLLMYHSANNAEEIFFSISSTIGVLFIIFMFCEIGQRIYDRTEMIGVNFLLIDWYMLPLSVTKILPILLSGLQMPVSMNGMGNITCTREAFKNVWAKVYSYFTALQQF